MKLGYEEIKEITTGAARIEQEDKYIRFYRFTQEEEDLYKQRSDNFYEWSKYTAGIRLMFDTDSESLSLKVNVPENFIRKFFSLDVTVNGEFIGSIDNFYQKIFSNNYTQACVYEKLLPDLTFGDFAKSFELGEGKKTVVIYLPYSVALKLEELSLDDGAFIEAVKPKKKLLVYGDSITQGFDILRSCNHYIPRLANVLGAEVFSKAIAGEVFWSELTSIKQSYTPDYIVVSYGTNDWSSKTEESFKAECVGFFEKLINHYPASKVFVLSPIWADVGNKETKFGKHEKVEMCIRDIVADFENAVVISGFDFLPHESKYFADASMHPNDEGFEHFFKNLHNAIEGII